MKIKEIKYAKKDGETSTRTVMPLVTKEKYEDCIDLSKLSKDEVREVLDLQMKYEISMHKYITKAFRRFSLEGMEVLHEDKFDVDKTIEEIISSIK